VRLQLLFKILPPQWHNSLGKGLDLLLVKLLQEVLIPADHVCLRVISHPDLGEVKTALNETLLLDYKSDLRHKGGRSTLLLITILRQLDSVNEFQSGRGKDHVF
jgi:hypothetical protein